jgi:hypothetical protein
VAKYNQKPQWGVWYTNELYYSSAYQELTLIARDLLHCFMNEVDVKSVKSRNRTNAHFYPNNGKISVTQNQFRNQFPCVKQSYINARNLLIKVGCIKMTYRGGTGIGDMAQYKILTLKEIPDEQQRWRNYPDKNWAKEIPKAKKSLVGVSTRFTKGISGRKR